MAHEFPDLKNGQEIESIGDFIKNVSELRHNKDGVSENIYFRGQEVDFWGVEPSIFRSDMLSIEHILMQQPLRKFPTEFKEFSEGFNIMTKYQHYGMSTRLLDLTTNPLVALYFACQRHGEEKYINIEGNKYNIEPYGIVYYKFDYPIFSDTIEVKIISALAQYDLTKDNTVKNVVGKLLDNNVISVKDKEWLTKNNYKNFIDIIQNDYLVLPTYSNERMIKQSGVFLLSGSFSFNTSEDFDNSIIVKCKQDLLDLMYHLLQRCMFISL